MPVKYATQQQFQPPKVPNGWKPEEKRYAQQIEDLFRKLFSRFGRLRFEDLGDGVRLRINGLAEDYSELELRLQGFAAAVNGNRLDFSAAGLQVINASGDKVFTQDTKTGNLAITGTIYAESGEIGGFTVGKGKLSAAGIELNAADDGRITVRDVTVTEPDATGKTPNVVLLEDGTLATSDYRVPKAARGTVSVVSGAPVTLDFTEYGFLEPPIVVCTYSSAGNGGVLTVSDKTATSAVISGTNTTAQSVDFIAME